MALTEVCGLKDLNEFGYRKSEIDENGDMDALYDNFSNSPQVMMPPFSDAVKGLQAISRDENGRQLKIDFHKGTTTLGFLYQGGVILAVDSRATGGRYIGSGSMRKVTHINDYLLGTMAGGAADCVYWERVLSKQCRTYELRNRERISVAAASKLLSNIVYNYKGMGLSMGVMIAGWDKRGPKLYYVDSDGQRLDGKVFSVGSGSTYAFGVLDTGYRWDLTDEEAQELGRKSIFSATYRDIATGGIVRVYNIKSTGWVCISEEDCKDLYDKYHDEKMQ